MPRLERYKRTKIEERGSKVVLLLLSLFAVLAFLVITVYLFASGLPFIVDVGFYGFFIESRFAPLASNPSYGISAMLVTTLYVTALSTILGGLLGLFCAMGIYAFIPNKLKKAMGFCINLLSGIPSVIYGLFGMSLIVPFLRDYLSPTGVGYGVLASTLVLSLMILPTMVSMSLDALNATDPMVYQGALALGSSKQEALFKVVMPSASSGIFAALVLSLGRAMGETMAVIMVSGGSVAFPSTWFTSVRTLTGNIAMGATELGGRALDSLVACGLVLFVLTLLVNLLFALFRRRMKDERA